MKRRTFLKFSSASAAAAFTGTAGLIAWQPRAHAATISKEIWITEGTITQPDGVDVYFRGFSGSNVNLDVPGQVLVMAVGDTYNLTIHNSLNSSHNFVVDELGINTSIPAGSTRSVTIAASNPGTFIYYDNSDLPNNRLVGLHGALVVFPSGANTAIEAGRDMPIHDFVWLFHDIDPVWHDAIRRGNKPPNNYVPRYFTLNGLNGRPPGAVGAHDPAVDSMVDPRTALHGALGDRTMVRCINTGRAQHAVHCHGNHMEWLSLNGKQRQDVWLKDVIALDGNGGRIEFIYPFETPPDAWPPIDNNTFIQAEAEGRHTAYPMHLHDEMTQTAGGGLYMFGALTDIYFNSK